jgi:hypothetical protein
LGFDADIGSLIIERQMYKKFSWWMERRLVRSSKGDSDDEVIKKIPELS